MDQVREIAHNVSAIASDAWEYIEAETGLSPIVLVTVMALLVGAYFLISGILVPSQIRAAPPATSDILTDADAPSRINEISLSDLSEYDGKDVEKPLLLAIKGEIYDVSSARDYYGPDGLYSVFAGKDASRALAKMSFDDGDFSGDLAGLSEHEMLVLRDWESKFVCKYPKVGVVKTVAVSHVDSDSREAGDVVNQKDEPESHKNEEAQVGKSDKVRSADSVEDQHTAAAAKSDPAVVDDFRQVEPAVVDMNKELPSASSGGETVTSVKDSEEEASTEAPQQENKVSSHQKQEATHSASSVE